MELSAQDNFSWPEYTTGIDTRIDDVHMEETRVVTLFSGDQEAGKNPGGEDSFGFVSPTLRHVR